MKRLDIVLVQRGLAESRHQAKRLILAGAVKVNNNSNVKPGQRISVDAELVVEESPKYVSRGGLKLEKALRTYDMTVQNKVFIDVGASTGGFTDCLLQHGAGFVYAIDVGYGQLAWKLRKHPNVHVLDKTNIRYIDQQSISHPIDMAVIDVSFISLRTVLPVLVEKLGVMEMIALVKPQFEAGRKYVKKGGVVDDPSVHTDTLINLITFMHENYSTIFMGLTYSPIYRDIRNIEYLLWLRKSNSNVQLYSNLANTSLDIESYVRGTVREAHREFYVENTEKRDMD